MNRHSRSVVLAAGFVLAAFASHAQVVPIRPTERPGTVKSKSEDGIVRSRNVLVQQRGFVFDQRSITIPLLDRNSVTAFRDGASRTKFGDVWTGISRDRTTRVTWVRRGDVVVADIITAKATYQLRYAGNGVHQLREIDVRRLGDDAEPEPAKIKRDPEADVCATDPPDEIDVMVVYTDDARADAGSTEAMEAEIVLAVEEANQAYIDSDIVQRLRIVHLAEVAYDEQSDSVIHREQLQNPSDGIIDNIHALRDAHGADLVSMITLTSEAGNCGRAFIMDTVDTAFDEFAFSVLKRDCSTAPSFSFTRELGHNMSGRHDWDGDDTNNAPFAFNHGHFDDSPNAPAGDFATMMTRKSACATCTRLQVFSNPNINEPVGNTPLGVNGAEATDNHQALNNTASTVANLRCSSPNTTNVWMKDTWSDTGAEPDPATASESMWRSPYIWVRNDQDTTLTRQHMHENPSAGSDVFAYAKLHNGGNSTTSGTLELYFANADVSLEWPVAWTLIGSVPVNNFVAHAARVVEVPWNGVPTAGDHYCLIARWVSASDPMATAEGTDINANVRANNNIVWRNLNIIDADDEDVSATFWVTNRSKEPMRASLVIGVPKEARNNFLRDGRVLVMLDGELSKLWIAGGRKLRGLQRGEKGLFLVTGSTGAFDGLVIPPDFRGRVLIRFEKTPATRGTTYFVDATLLRNFPGTTAAATQRVVGGVSYEIHTERGYRMGTTVQRAR
jgi:Metallo-peptidase family M12B Reprolysin-like